MTRRFPFAFTRSYRIAGLPWPSVRIASSDSFVACLPAF